MSLSTMTVQPGTTGGTIPSTAFYLVRQHSEWRSGEEHHVIQYIGPYSQLAAAYDWCKSNYLSASSIVSSASHGSAIATLTVTYPVGTTFTFLPHEIRQPVYDIVPVEVVNDLRSFYVDTTAVTAVQLDAIDNAIRNGTISALLPTLTGAAQNYARWRAAGVTGFRRTIYNLRIQRFFDNAQNYPDLTQDYLNIFGCMTWTQLSTAGQPVPAWITQPTIGAFWNSTTKSETYGKPWIGGWGLLWLFCSITPQYQGSKGASIVWEWLGALDWPQDFYRGGTWQAPAI